MPSIHFVERINKVTKIQGTTDEWESGNWKVGKETARSLIGGDLYLHSEQIKPSHFGGKIISYWIHQEGDANGRVVFRIQATMAHKGVVTGREGWSQEMKLDS